MTLNEWIMFGRVGSSSKTMWGVLTDTIKSGYLGDGRGTEIPYDPDDLSRCIKLVDDCGVTVEDRQKIKRALPCWAPFIDNWDLMVSMFNHERADKKHERKLYKLMQTYVDEARVISGWEQTYPGCWEHKNGTTTTIK